MNLRLGARRLRRSPGFAAAAILTFALGMAASTTLFSVVYGVLLRPLPYRDGERLTLVQAEQTLEGARQPVRTYFGFAALEMWPLQPELFEAITFSAEDVGTLAGRDGSEVVDVAVVSGSFFSAIGGRFALGRPLDASDDLLPSAVISERLWQRRFNAASDAIGQQVILNAQAFTIVGVAGATFQLPAPQTDVWTPAGFVRTLNPACCGFTPIARLTAGVSVAQATEHATLVTRALAVSMPRYLRDARVRAIGLHEHLVTAVRPALLILFTAGGLLVMLACANVMNLLLARNLARSHETAVRRALGASRGRLLSQALVETGFLTAAGGALGTALAALSVAALKQRPASWLPRLDAVHVDGTVVLFAFAVAALSGLVAGALPALQSHESGSALKVGRHSSGRRPAARVMLRAITVSQLAIGVVLLVGAVLLGRSLVELMRTDLGVATDHVATASLNLALDRKVGSRQQHDIVTRIVARVRALPGVTAAGVGAARPPDRSRTRLTLNRTDDTTGNTIPFQAAAVPATPDYFRALGVRLRSGRFFTDADSETAVPVIIVGADTARLLFGEQDALGRTIGLPILRDGVTGHQEMTVVGVTDNVKYAGLDQVADAVVYRPFAQQPWPSVFLVARTTGDPTTLASVLRREVAAVDPAVVVSDVTTLDAVLSDATAQPRFRTLLLVAFAALAVSIAAVGLYGVIAYSVSQRTQEIGIRVALGAGRGDILKMVMGEGLVLTLLGAALGCAGALAATRLLVGLLYGVTPTDVTSFGLAAIGLVGVGLVASYVPARRAVRVDPVITLRNE